MNHLSYASLLVSAAVGSLTAQGLPSDFGKLAAAIESPASEAARCKASHLVGCPVTDSKRISLGKIQDIVLDAGNHRIAYAVVTFEKSLGMGEKRFVMPWRLIEVGRSSAGDELRATLMLDRATLKAAPGFDGDQWPDMTDATWSKRVDSYYSSQNESLPQKTIASVEDHGAGGVRGIDAALTGRVPSHCLLSKMFGAQVIDEHQRTLATAEDLVVDTGSARVDGVLLGFGGVLGRGEHFALVPSEALSVNKMGVLVLPCSFAGLEAMALKEGKWPVLNNDAWLTKARKLCAEACEDARVADGDVIPTDVAAVTPVAFADSYDLAKVETVKGTITTVGSVLVGSGKEERVRLRILADKGREVIVYAAPATFDHQQALGLRAGGKVEVTGSPAEHCTHTVLVAGSMTCAGKTAVLRDDQGHPSWTKK